MIRSVASALCVIKLAGGCARQAPLYCWGHYEPVIYTSYNAPGDMPPAREIEILEADYQKARAHNRPVPPGWHAHVGYLYYQVGKLDQAKQEFETEKQLFPESTVFMDRLLKNTVKK